MLVNTKWATGIAILFHTIGLGGMLWKGVSFASSTPWHLLLMFALLVWSYGASKNFLIAAAITWLTGFVAEWIGVHTGILFGYYQYGTTLGFKWLDIPLLIGCNWVIIMAGATSISHKILANRKPTTNDWQLAIISAAIATAADWLLEPIAIKLGYWNWQGGIIPLHNYVCWFGLSFLLSLAWKRLKIAPNQFGINLFIIQCIFFILLRLLL